MDDWLRDGLNEIASDAPQAVEVPRTLPGRARRRIVLMAVITLSVASSLVIGAVAGVRALVPPPHRGGDQVVTPSPSPSSTGRPNVVRITLSDAGCTLRSGPIVPGRLSFSATNTTIDRAVFDIGIIDPGHDYAELRSAADRIDGGVVARSIDDVAELRPSFLRGSLAGRSPGGGRPLIEQPTSLFAVIPSEGARWLPTAAAVPAGSSLAVMCYRGSVQNGFEFVGVAGPVSTSPERDQTPPAGGGTPARGVHLASITLGPGGCWTTPPGPEPIEVDFVRFTFKNQGPRNGSFLVGILAEGMSFAELDASLAIHVGVDAARWPGVAPPGVVRLSDSVGGIGFPHGGAGPHIGNPFSLKDSWTATWNGPKEEHGPLGSEELVVICYRDAGTGRGESPVDVLGPYEVR